MLNSFFAAVLLAQTPATQPQAPSAPRLEFTGGVFIITDSAGVTRVDPKTTPSVPPRKFEAKVGTKMIGWSEKGLTISVGKQSRTTRFGDLPLSPRFFTTEALTEVNGRLAKKELTREASGLSGWEQIGDVFYLLPRWNDSRKKPWLEMLVKVDMSQPTPWFETLAVWRGLTPSSLVVEDFLVAIGNSLYTVSESDGGWGTTEWNGDDPTQSTFQEVGRFPRTFAWNTAAAELRFVERTSYGTQLAGRFDLRTKNRSNLAESRDPISFPGETSESFRRSLRNRSSCEMRTPVLNCVSP